MESLKSFKYLGRLLIETYYDWLAVILKLQQQKKSYYILSNTLGLVGHKCSDAGSLLSCDSAGHFALRSRYLGYDPVQLAFSGGVLPQVGTSVLE